MISKKQMIPIVQDWMHDRWPGIFVEQYKETADLLGVRFDPNGVDQRRNSRQTVTFIGGTDRLKLLLNMRWHTGHAFIAGSRDYDPSDLQFMKDHNFITGHVVCYGNTPWLEHYVDRIVSVNIAEEFLGGLRGTPEHPQVTEEWMVVPQSKVPLKYTKDRNIMTLLGNRGLLAVKSNGDCVVREVPKYDRYICTPERLTVAEQFWKKYKPGNRKRAQEKA